MLEENITQHNKIVPNKYAEISAAYQMKNYDYVLRLIASATTGAYIVTLPSVVEAKGRTYSFLARDADATNKVTISDGGDSESWSDLVLNNTGEGAVFYSDGLTWFALSLVNIS